MSAASAAVSLLTPVVTGGIQNTNFVNGRVLTADDLRALQLATHLHDAQLGRVIGDGVAEGLEVTLSAASTTTSPILHVTKGLGLNRKGEAVELTSDLDVAFIPPATVAAADAGAFTVCQPPRGVGAPTNLGLYVFAASPASQYQGSAPVTGLTTNGVATSCASKYAVEGVSFKMIPLPISATDPAPLAARLATLVSALDTLLGQIAAGTASASQAVPLVSQLRNGAAYLCFGFDTYAAFATNPFATTFGEYGALDGLRDAGTLTDCDVPLALVYWTATGVQFVDAWAVRRPIVAAPPSSAWPIPSARRRAAEGLSMFLQFEAQVADLVASTSVTPSQMRVTDYFWYLPPIGLLTPTNGGGAAAFNYAQFFANRTILTPVFIEGAKLLWLWRQASEYPPIDLTNQELIWLYVVRENIEPDTGNQYLIFTNGQMPFFGDARYDLNYWNFANYD